MYHYSWRFFDSRVKDAPGSGLFLCISVSVDRRKKILVATRRARLKSRETLGHSRNAMDTFSGRGWGSISTGQNTILSPALDREIGLHSPKHTDHALFSLFGGLKKKWNALAFITSCRTATVSSARGSQTSCVFAPINPWGPGRRMRASLGRHLRVCAVD